MPAEYIINEVIDVNGSITDLDAVLKEVNRFENAIQQVNKNPINIGGIGSMKELREAATQLTQSLNQLNTTISGLSKANTSKVFQDHSKAVNDATAATKENTAAQKENLTWTQFVSQRMSQYMKVYGDHATAIRKISEEWKEYKATGQNVVQTSEQIASAQQKEIAGVSEKDAILSSLNEKYQQATVLAKNLADQFGADSEQAKNAAKNAAQLKEQIEQLNATKPATTTPNISAYEALKKETKEAELNAKNLAAQFGVDSKEALEAAAAYDVLKNKLAEVNSITRANKATPAPFNPNDVPFTNNTGDLERQNQELEKTGTVVNDLEKQYAETTNAVTAWGNAQANASEQLQQESSIIPELIGEFDQYTGSLRQNITAQIENNVAIQQNRALQKQIQAEIASSGAGGPSQAQLQKLAQLREEELLLVETNKNLSTTIRNQAKDFISAEGSIDEMRAKLALLQKSYEQLSLAEKQQPFGVAIKSQIDLIDPALRKAEEGIGKAQRSVGGYSNAITKAFSGAWSAVRQFAYLIPGLGIAGIMGFFSDAIIAGFTKFITIFQKTKTDAERLAEELSQATTEIQTKAAENAAGDYAKLELLRKVITDTKKPIEERNGALKEYNEIADKANQINKDEINNISEVNSKIDSQITLIKERALARASEAIVAQKAQDYLTKLEEARSKAAVQFDAQLRQGLVVKINRGGGSKAQDYVDLIERQGAIETQALNDPSVKDAKEKLDASLKSALQFNLDFTTSKGSKTTTKANTDSKDYADELYKQQKELRDKQDQLLQEQLKDKIDYDKEIVDNDKESFSKRLQYEEQFYNDSLQKLNDQKRKELTDSSLQNAEEKRLIDRELQNKNLTTKQRQDLQNTLKVIEQKGDADRLLIEAKFNSQFYDLNKNRADKILQLTFQSIEKQKQEQANQHENDLSNLSNEYESQLLQLDKAFAAGQIKEKEYNKQKLQLQEQYQVESLKKDIEYTKTVIELAEARAQASGNKEDIDAVAKAKSQLAALEIKLAKTVTDFVIDQRKQDDKDDQDAFDKKMKRLEQYSSYAKEVFNIIGGFVQNSVDRQKNAIQDQIDLLDQQKQKEIDLANQTILNSQQKADAIAVIEAKSQAQKEILQRRQRALDEQKARFDKAANIASIISDTALAVIRALGDKTVPYPVRVAYAVAAGVIGAAQLAKAIATPIPRYFRGKNVDAFTDNYEGPALINDGGKREAIIREDGSVEFPQKMNTIEWIGAKDIVLPDAQMLAWQATKSAAQPMVFIETKSDALSKQDYIYGVKNIVTAIKNQPRQKRQDPNYELMKAWMKSNRSYRDFFG